MFDEDEESNPRIILIEGSPGTGKTTLSLKIAYEWAMGAAAKKVSKSRTSSFDQVPRNER